MGCRNGLKGKTYEEVFGIEKAKKIKLKISNSTKKAMDKYRKKYKNNYVFICAYCQICFFKETKRKHFGKNTFCKKQCYYCWLKENKIRPPSRKGTTISEAHKKAIGNASRKKWKEDLKYRHKMVNFFIMNPEKHPLQKMAKRRLAQGLKKGYISNQQEKLFVMVKKVFNRYKVELEFPLKYQNRHFYLDVAVPKLKLNFEYDGEYWHQDKEKDRIRDKKIISLGWTVFRFDNILLREYLCILKFFKKRFEE